MRCNQLALMYFLGKGAPKNHRKALKLYRRTCAAGEMTGCLGEGLMHLAGKGTPKNKKRARRLLKMVCDRGIKEACQYVK